MENPLANSDEGTQQYLQAQEKLMQALENRGQPNITAMLAAMSRPTPTGQFDFGAGGAELARQQQEQEKIEPSLIQMRAQLAQKAHDYKQNLQFKQLANQLYSNSSTGMPTLNRNVLQNMMALDPKSTNEILAGKKAIMQENLQDAQSRFINDPSDKEALKDIAINHPNGFGAIIDIAKTMPKIRSLLGKSGKDSEEATPFDVLASIPDAVIGGQARILRKKVLDGTIDEDKANTLATQMLQMYTTSNDKRELHGMMASVTNELKNLQIAKLKQEVESYQSPEEKIIFSKSVAPLYDKNTQAKAFKETLDAAREIIKQAPSGPVEGTWYNTIGKFDSKNPKTIAQTSLESLTPQIVLAMPKFSSRGTVYDEKLHNKAAGDLSNPLLSRENRLAQIDRLEKSLDAHVAQNDEIINNWQKYKKIITPTPIDLPKVESQKQESKFKIIGTTPVGGQ